MYLLLIWLINNFLKGLYKLNAHPVETFFFRKFVLIAKKIVSKIRQFFFSGTGFSEINLTTIAGKKFQTKCEGTKLIDCK